MLSSHKIRWRIGFFLILLISGVLYAQSLGGALIWDDHVLVEGSGIGGGKSLEDCFREPFLGYYYRPMVSATFFLDKQVWGTIPFGFHQTNILLHILTTAILIGLLRSLFRRSGIALLGGLLFAVQPAQVSTVAWIGGRTDSLCTLFVALFAWALVSGVRSAGRRRTLLLAGATLAYAAALFTKEQMLALLPLIPLAFHCFRLDQRPTINDQGLEEEKRRAGERESGRAGAKTLDSRLSTLDSAVMWRTLAACLGVSAVFVLLWVLLGPPRPASVMHSLPAILGQAGRTITYYFLLLLTPTPQAMHTLSLGALEQAGLWPVLVGYGLLALSIGLFRRWSRTEPAAAWFLALVLLTLLPVLNFLPMPSLLVGPYRAGVAGLGVAALLGWALGRYNRVESRESRVESRRNAQLRPHPFIPSSLHPFIFCLLTLWYGGLTAWGTQQWKDERTAFSTFVRLDPHSIIARLNLTSTLLTNHQHRPAIHHLETMLDQIYRSPVWRDTDAALAALHTNTDIMNRVRQNQGNRIEPEEWLSALFAQLGFAYLEAEERKTAESLFRTSVRLNRQSSEAHLGLGYCANYRNDTKSALRHLSIAVAANPKRVDAHAKLGRLLAELGRWKEAKPHFAYCIEEQPWAGQAYIEMANAQTHMGDRAGAEATLRAALRHSPNRADVRTMLANL